MNNIKYIGLSLVIALSLGFSGCGDSRDSIAGTPEYFILGEQSRIITLPNDEILISGHGCTTHKAYDSTGILVIDKSDGTIYDSLLAHDDYTFVFENMYNDVTGQGILFYLSGNFYISPLPVNTEINVSAASSYIYKLQLSAINSYTITQSNTYVTVYDSQLNYIGTTHPWVDDLADPLTLNAGTYYFIHASGSCYSSGSYSITEI